jgi:hypothetical protein
MKKYEEIQRIAPLIAFILGIWYFCIRILGYNLGYIPGDLGDSRFINFLLEHGHRWITGDVPAFWDGEFMYPFKNTIAMSDSMLGTMPVYSLFRIFGLSPESAYQWWWISICALNYWVSYYIFKKWFNREIAVVLAWIFAFTIFNIGQLNYMQMIIRFMVPVVFYAAYRMVVSPSVKYLSIYCFGIIFQFYCAMYTGFYLLYFSGLFILIYYLFSKNWKDLAFYFGKDMRAYTSIVFILSLAALLWLFIPYLKMSKIIGMLHYGEVEPNIPYLSSYLFPTDSSITWRFLFNHARPDVPIWWLHFLFAGIIPFLAMIISPCYLLYNWYKKAETPLIVKSFIVTSIIIILFHIRSKGGFSLYPILFKFPGLSTIRVLIRFMNVEIFLLLLACGFALVKIKKSIYLYLFFLIAFADNLFNPEYIPRQKKADLIHRKEILLAKLEKYDFKKYKAVALVDTTETTFIVQLDMMLVAQSAGIKTVNGYSSNCPQALQEFTKNGTEKGLVEWLLNQKINRDEILLIKPQEWNKDISNTVNYGKAGI